MTTGTLTVRLAEVAVDAVNEGRRDQHMDDQVAFGLAVVKLLVDALKIGRAEELLMKIDPTLAEKIRRRGS